MSKMIINGGGAGGTGSDECTARLSDIPAGLKAVTADSNDEAGVGTMTMTGNAQAAHVLAGETFYTNNCKTKLTGTMTVNSLLSFSVAAYSGRRVLAKWQNPNQAAGKPFSGVIIRYSTSGYPGTTGGTQIYKGAGNNTAAGAWSQTYLDMPALNTTYYFSCYPYVTTGGGVINGIARNVTCKTSGELNKTFTASGSYTIPGGYNRMDVYLVGGGGGTLGEPSNYGGGGAGSGYTLTEKSKTISTGQILTVVVGAGGYGTRAADAAGGASYISGITQQANGGKGAGAASRAGDGGSGGGVGSHETDETDYYAGAGGTNGGNGTGYGLNGKGQGTTTRAWGSTTGTLYAGGGGGGGGYPESGGAGGTGGGGRGGNRYAAGTAGTSNTGGGAGGNGYKCSNVSIRGGSGVVLVKLY